MTGDVAAGDIATGALVARAVEPVAGEPGESPSDGLCLNCGTARMGPFCHACGQTAHVHRTLASIGHDLLHGVFHFEGKIWRTLPLLAWRPGDLTRRYIAGERARFVSPLAAFLFSVFLLFAVLGSLPGWNLADGDLLSGTGVAEGRLRLIEQRDRAARDVAARQDALAAARRTGDRTAIDRAGERLTEARDAMTDLSAAIAVLPAPRAGSDDARMESTPANWIDGAIQRARRNPDLLLYKVRSEAYKYSWALIPLSLPLIWLLFPFRRDVGLYEHAVFATYSPTFMSLLVVVLALLGALGLPGDALSFGWLLVPPWHIYRQLHGAYALTRAGALWRTALLIVFALAILVCFVAALVYIGIAD